MPAGAGASIHGNMSATAKPQVISVSRRSDIPAFYAEWFMTRLRAGFARYRNPFGGKICEVSLKPEDVLAFVFWSRNYAPLLPHLPELDDRGYRAYFHFTLTDYGKPLEPFAPPTSDVVKSFHTLAEQYSPQHVLWRFDPIVLSKTMPSGAIVEKFSELAQQLEGTTGRCYISFIDLYRKVQKNLTPLEKQGFQLSEISQEAKLDLLRQLQLIGDQYGISLHACCEADMLQLPGIQQAHCVDPLLLHKLFPNKFHPLKPASTREGCGCYASRDIGAYDSCVHGCLYCYANANHETALKHFKSHDPAQPSLVNNKN